MTEKQRGANSAPGFLSGYGEMGALIESKDWSATIGPPGTWPKSLQTVVRIMLGSRHAISIGWGPDLTFLYNDAYGKMTLGQKHPWALGQPAREVWAEAWADLGPRVEEVLRRGQATLDEDLPLMLSRSGYSEETYHTFSYSPLPDDNGNISGLLCIVVENTQRFIAARRLAVIRELASQTAGTRSLDELFDAISRSLSTNPRDLPFTLIYLIDEGAEEAQLKSRAGFTGDHPAAPASIQIRAEDAAWPIGESSRRGDAVIIDDLAQRFADLPKGAWKVSPGRAVAVPITRPGQKSPAGVLIAGLNPHRPFNDIYAEFIGLLAGQIATGLANVHAYEDAQRRAVALAEIDRAKTIFFSNASDELRTPLTLILGPLEELLRQNGSHGTVRAEREAIELVYRNGLRLLRLVNTLLDFSRIEAGRLQPVAEATDLAAYTSELASTFRSAIEQAGLRYNVNCPPLGEPAYIDREMWEKIVLNLVSNAFKYTLDGAIALSLSRSSDGQQAQLVVRDTGIGIPDHELPKLFERFHRIERQDGRSHEGNGIGLALVRELVRLQGGTIEVESAAGQGSAFIVTMPLGTGHLPADFDSGKNGTVAAASGTARVMAEEAFRWMPAAPLASPGLATASGASAASDHGHPSARLLVADDNADMRDYLRRLLEPSYQVEAVADGKAALAAARRQRPDLILSDVTMPAMDGFALLRALREEHDLRNLPVILLSARAGEEASIEGLEAGAVDYLVKPFSARELLLRVRNNLEMAAMQREAGRIENELRREVKVAQELAEGILASMNDGFFDLDQDWRISFVNAAAMRFMEHSSDELLGQIYWDQFSAIVGTETESHLRRAMADRMPTAFETYYPPWQTWVDVRVYPSRAGGLSIYFQDITERKLAAESLRRLNDTLETQVMERTAELQAKELRLRTIFETSFTFQGLMTVDGTLIDANTTSLDGIGMTLEEVKGKPLWETLWFSRTPNLAEKVRAAVPRVAAGEAIQQEINVNLPVGGWRWFDFALRPVRNDQGEVIAIAPEAVEVTARRQAEEALRQAHKMEAIGQLTGGVAHDFNNLLQIIVGNLHLLERRVAKGDAPEADLQRLIEGAMRGSRRAATLTQRLLAFSRRQPLDPKALEVNRLVARMSELHRTLGENIGIETVLGGGLWRILCDAGEFENALLNLAVNARDAMPEGGRLTIETANAYIDDAYASAQEEVTPGQYVMVAVSDTGTGMTDEVMARAFEPFFTTKGTGHGTGLGLSQVYGFVRQSGGYVKIHSKIDEGTTVKIYMPRLVDDALTYRERTAPSPLMSGSEREIILVVEDDDDVRANTIAMLRELGYGVLEASDGFSALEILSRGAHVDLLFTDVGLPGGMNGRQLADKVRQLRPELRVLFTSGYARSAIVHQGRLDSGIELLSKPFTLSQLSAKIHRMLKDGD